MSTIRQSGLGRLGHVAKVGVEVGADRLVGEEGRGLRAVFDGLNPERVIIASISAGIGRYAIGKAVRYARERTVWGTPIARHQGIAHPLAEAQIHLEAARLMIRQAATLYDSGQDTAPTPRTPDPAAPGGLMEPTVAADLDTELHPNSCIVVDHVFDSARLEIAPTLRGGFNCGSRL
jgi:alkylation response protein AidB-like acyl-CoA dehydrogenase